MSRRRSNPLGENRWQRQVRHREERRSAQWAAAANAAGEVWSQTAPPPAPPAGLRAALDAAAAVRAFADAANSLSASLDAASASLAALTNAADPADDDAVGWRQVAEQAREELARERDVARRTREHHDRVRASRFRLMMAYQAMLDADGAVCCLCGCRRSDHASDTLENGELVIDRCQYGARPGTWTPSKPGAADCYDCRCVFVNENGYHARRLCATHAPAEAKAVEVGPRGIRVAED